MTLAAETLWAVFDAFQRKEGVWRATLPVSYQILRDAVTRAQLTFAEWDPQRGIYFLDFSPLGSNLITLDLLLLDFRGDRGSDHYRFEWAEGGILAGVELQTHAPGPLPFVPEIAEWIEPGRIDVSPALTLDAWHHYLEGLIPQTPIL
ncbi:MAG TPA: hypothetical protein VMB23_07950 [Spirochaetia bacterium]|jgi:hypothetical protein|nr:hypothetical protein [Spirochaetia bacterium]